MKSPPVTVTGSTLILEAQKIMKGKGMRRLPVVDAESHLVGLVTQDKLREGNSNSSDTNECLGYSVLIS